MANRLTLKKALETSRLDDFIAQEEARGVGPHLGTLADRLVRSIRSRNGRPRSGALPMLMPCSCQGTRPPVPMGVVNPWEPAAGVERLGWAEPPPQFLQLTSLAWVPGP